MQVVQLDGRMTSHEGTLDEMLALGAEQMQAGARSMRIFKPSRRSKPQQKQAGRNKMARRSRRRNRK